MNLSRSVAVSKDLVYSQPGLLNDTLYMGYTFLPDKPIGQLFNTRLSTSASNTDTQVFALQSQSLQYDPEAQPALRH